MFSGQGSQYFHMGVHLFENNQNFRTSVLYLDEVVRDQAGVSVVETIYSKDKRRSDEFSSIVVVHSALYIFQYALCNTLKQRGLSPDAVLGSSLGEYVSLAVSGVLNPIETLILVIHNAMSIEKHCQKATMLAVLESSSLYYLKEKLFHGSEIAAINCESHFVVSGSKSLLEEISDNLKKQDIQTQFIMTEYGFHSNHILPAKHACLNNGKKLDLKLPKIPIYSSAKENELNLVKIDYLWDVIYQPILFYGLIKKLEHKGPYIYIDLGPSGTLATYVKYSICKNSPSKIFNLMSPYGGDNLNIEHLLDYLSTNKE